MSVRNDRLQAEFEETRKLNSRVIHVEKAEGTPWPDIYIVEYDLKSIIRWNAGVPTYARGFRVRFTMPQDFPESAPWVRFVSDRFPVHPNIWPDGRICYTNLWPKHIGIPLVNIFEKVGQIMAYQEINLGDLANASIVSDVQSNMHLFPVDHAQIRLPDRVAPEFPPVSAARIKFGAGV